MAVGLGLLWSVLVTRLMGGSARESLAIEWLVAGVVAGLVASAFTLWSRTRTAGRERLRDVLATYYLAMVAYWATYVITCRAIMVARAGEWTDFGLSDHLRLIVSFVALGTLPYGLLLVPLTWASRALVWRLDREPRAR